MTTITSKSERELIVVVASEEFLVDQTKKSELDELGRKLIDRRKGILEIVDWERLKNPIDPKQSWFFEMVDSLLHSRFKIQDVGCLDTFKPQKYLRRSVSEGSCPGQNLIVNGTCGDA